LISIFACAPRVPSASVEEHRRLADAAEELGIVHEALYDPKQLVATIPCMELCFNPWTNPTEIHHDEAKRLWRLAEQHQRARRKLRVAEERACLGVPEHARELGAFVDCSNIAAIEWPHEVAEPVIVELAVADGMVETFRAELACQVARNESRGRELPQIPSCAQVLGGVEAEVVAIDEAGVQVELRVGDAQARAALRERLRPLVDARN
jgi:hypothetical protein